MEVVIISIFYCCFKACECTARIKKFCLINNSLFNEAHNILQIFVV